MPITTGPIDDMHLFAVLALIDSLAQVSGLTVSDGFNDLAMVPGQIWIGVNILRAVIHKDLS